MRSLQLLGLCLLLIPSGCIFNKASSVRPEGPPPQRITELPTEAELVRYLNKTDNPSLKINSFTADSVWISASAQDQKAPMIKGDLACEKPRNFRLRGKVAGFDQVDFGSNTDRFWFWIKESPDPHIFHCSYDDFERGVNLPFPFQPEWVLQVLGMADYNESGKYKITEKGDTFELTEDAVIQGKPVKKIVVFTRFAAVAPKPQILEHRIIDQQGRVIGSAKIDRVARDYRTGIVYPEIVQLEWPSEQIKMKLELNRVKLNQATNPNSPLYVLPDFRKQVDLGRLQNPYSSNSRIQPVESRRRN